MSESSYYTSDPSAILIAAGSHGSVEHLDPSSDTAAAVASLSPAIRRGGFGVCTESYSWLAGGTADASVERIDNTTYTDPVVAGADLPYMQANGASLSGLVNAYMVGDAWSANVSLFDYTSETASSLNTLPTRSVRHSGGIDDSFMWVFGGIDTSGSIQTIGQKMDLTTDTWTTPAGLSVPNGLARHSSTYRAERILMAGGVATTGMALSIQSIDVSTDTATAEFRSHLSLARHDLGSSATPLASWWCAGVNITPSSVIDRTDHYNDTTNASYRCDLTYPRSTPLVVGDRELIANTLADSDTSSIAVAADSFNSSVKGIIPYSIGNGVLRSFSSVYAGGGQNYTNVYSDIQKIDLSTETEASVNSSLSPRYALSALYNSDYTWFTGGLDSSGTELSVTERFDHSNEATAVVTGNPVGPVSYAGPFSAENLGYLKARSSLYSLDFSTGTWTSLTGEGTETFISGSGVTDRGVFAGGLDGSVPSNRVSILDQPSETWITHTVALSSGRFAISGASNFENTWFLGGTIRAQTDLIESLNHLSNHASVLWRGSLSSAKSRAQSIINSEYTWTVGGYRMSALSDLDKFDPFSDTISLSTRVSGVVRHSFGISAPFEYSERTGDIVKCILPTTSTSDILCYIHGVLFSGDVDAFTPSPHDTVSDDRWISAPHTPEEYGSTIDSVYSAGLNYSSDRSAVIPVTVTSDLLTYVSASIPLSDRISRVLADNMSAAYAYVGDDSAWAGGGLDVSYHERVDSGNLTPTVRGYTFLPRMGSAAGTSAEQAWIAGGHVLINTIELLIYSNDTVQTGDRSDLSVNRSYLSAFNNSTYCWYCGGIDSNGLVGIVDRLDKTNDTAAAVNRASDMPTARMAADVLFDRGYIIGGQVGVESKQDMRYILLDTDTAVHSVDDFVVPVHDHVVVGQDSSLVVFHQDSAYRYTPETGGVATASLPGYDRYKANQLDSSIWISGGTLSNARSGQTATYDPATDTHTVLPDSLNYARYNHWHAGRSSVTDMGSQTIGGVFEAVGTEAADVTVYAPRCSADHVLQAWIHIGQQHDGDISCLVVPPSGCHYWAPFENAWIPDRSGMVWRFEYNTSLPTPVGGSSPSSRRTTVSTGQMGYMIGGNALNLSAINYADETIREIIGDTDDICESAVPLTSQDGSLVIGGTRYTDAFNYSLAIVDTVRSWDPVTELLTVEDVASSRRRARSAGSRIDDSVGYILGGSIGELHQITDEIEKIDVSSDTFSVLTETMPNAADLYQAITNSQDELVTSNGSIFDRTTETASSAAGTWPSPIGESFANQSAIAILVGGATQRIEDPVVHGYVTPGTPARTLYNYDHSTGIMAYGPEVLPGLFGSAPMYPYSYCDPMATLKDSRSGIVHDSYGTYRTWVTSIVEREYTYTDRMAVVQESLTTESSDRGCIYTAFGSEKMECVSVSVDTVETGRACVCQLAVEHYESTVSTIMSANGTYSDDRAACLVWQQLASDRMAVAMFPDFLTVTNDIMGHVYIGGHITSRRCWVPAAYSANWDLFRTDGTAELLSKLVGTGDFAEILHKTIRSGLSTMDTDALLNTVESQFGQTDFIYSIDQGRGTRADEGVLIVAGSGVQIVRLIVRLSGTDMWVTSSDQRRFYLNCSKEYVIEGTGNVPIIGNIMVVTLKLAEPLVGELGFKFASARSSCHLKLVSM